MNDPLQTVDEPERQPTPPPPAESLPPHIGRYRVERILGKGGFGLVYLAYDDQLQRLVAIKVPHRERVSRPEDAQAYLTEARTVARLDHANIVPVYDSGSDEQHLVFIVSKYIEGITLAQRIKANRPSLLETVELMVTVAETLHYAHRKGLVHRDIKPGNILLDSGGKPFVADFGLALREQDMGRGPRSAGTPAYMSPEQANGEGHRVDGRSDIFSLGVVFYELLTGRRPFIGGSQSELLEQIASVEARPPRQWDDSIPKELERICLKALSKRATERFTTAKDMADDLRHFIEQASDEEKQSLRSSIAAAAVPSSAPTATPVPSPTPTPISDSSPLKIVPKGLRSFDAHDADFFLELLPGPRDRDGLPDSIRFWKRRIEEMDADNTFAVGLIYGPSGCGKSSLVKAGLLPRLSENAIAVYVKAAAAETETRLLNGLRKKCPTLPAGLGLKETLAALRRGQGIPAAKKLLIVLDQFEQWLHAKKDEEGTELVQALRQCDGGRLQCLVMVRDDFWLAVSRFLRELEIRLLEGQNSALVDLFDVGHAKKVLGAFGRAFGKLPDNVGETAKEQKEFLNQALIGLAQEGKVISVRLALFAEMMKGKPWTPAALKDVGGAEGVGAAFLEETFSAATAPPQHRYHQKAARAVLKSLLPESGTDIKGHMRSHDELLAASGYHRQPKDFEELLRILDSEIRLITPTDPEGQEEQDAPSGVLPDTNPTRERGIPSPSLTRRVGVGTKYYQLTHDYLVPSLRDWLTRKQKETRRGRAELLLADRAAVWTARPENRQLPSLSQWLRIRCLTQKKNWSKPQRQMMRKAARHHALRGAVVAVLLAAATAIGLVVRDRVDEQRQATHAAGLVQALVNADTSQVPAIVAQMAAHRKWTDPLLREEFDEAASSPRRKLHASLALLSVDAAQVEYLHGRLLDAEPSEVAVIRDALDTLKETLVDKLWSVVEAPAKGKESQRLRAAAALAKFDPHSAKWAKAQEAVSNDLVAVPALHLGMWMGSLRPLRHKLLPQLSAVYRDTSRRDVERSLATDILADYAADNPQFLADLLMDADDKQFAVIYPKLQSVQEKGQAVLRAELEIRLQPKWSDPPLDSAWKSVDGQLVRKIEAAHGSVQERFAFCQTMPLEEFLTVVEQLRTSGYRPTRFRPYVAAGGVQVAAVWVRDGREWQLVHGLTADEIRKRDAELRKQSFQPIDVNGYESAGKEVYAMLWVKTAADAAPAQMALGLEAEAMSKQATELKQKGYHKSIYTRSVSSGGTIRLCAIWTKAAAAQAYTEIETDYGGNQGLQVDVQISKAEPIPSTKERYTKQLKETEKLLKSKSNNVNARLQRAVAYFNLGDNDKALADLSSVIKQAPQAAAAYQYRAFVQARLGKAKEAKSDLTEFQKLNSDPSQGAYTDVVVAAYLGEAEPAVKRLETEVAANAKQAGFLYNAACAYSLACAAVAKKDRAKAKTYGDRAAALLKEAISQGYSDYSAMEIDADLDPIRQHPAYAALWKGAALDRRYTSVWHESAVLGSVEEHGSGPAGHLASCKSLMAQGYRPASVSVLELEDGRKTTASVWQRPFVAENDKERLAKRQANAGVALLRLNQPEKVWPLLKHSPDPRVRSYLIHRLSPLGADAGAIVKRLDEEPDITIRRALILSLGEFGDTELSPAARQALMPKLQDIYRSDADPGLHAAAEWLLRIWKQQDWLKQINDEWAKDKEQRSKRLERIGQQLKANRAASAPGVPRQWYVNSQGQTMVVIPGPVEFVMGSPPSEADRRGNETQHKKRIGRTFALPAAAVTKEQFLKFEVGWSHTEFRRYPEPTCPIGGIIWYQAAAYCNWLSEQEGIPEDQWCYEVENKQATKLKANYLDLTGYRLPTEAEMEYATRAGALTRLCYGETAELLPKYAWYLKNSQEKTWPVGSLKPNDFGLFDVHGNVYTWCQERYLAYPLKAGEDKEDTNSINIQEGRVLRGGSFNYLSSYVRCANRYVLVPSTRFSYVGLRPARTYR